jgi:hypothetical protein
MGRKHLRDESEIPMRVLAHREEPLETRILVRGELEDPGELVQPGFPARIANEPALDEVTPERRRAALADWLASRDHPLTARVMVNRVWQWHFGQGLVATPNDFGVRGDRPTHPGLLDWLAVEFMDHGWSLKHLHRTLMLSSTYQMAATADPATVERDPDNRLLARFQPRRLEAEAVWDSIRAVAGTLNRTLYGLPFAPPLDEQEQIGNFRKWPVSTPEEEDRRAVYLLVKRSFRFPMLSAFDLPENTASCGRRDITTVPNQALTLMNNRTIRQQAAAFADRLLRESRGDPSAIPARAWTLAYGRHITPEEYETVEDFLRTRIQASADDSDDATRTAIEELCLALFNTNEFIYLQ